MKKFNSQTMIAVLCAGTFLASSPSNAQWPTYDVQKVLNSIQTYTTTAQGYQEMVSQTTSITSMQQAIGDNVGSLSQFVDEDIIKQEDLEKAEKKRKRLEKLKKLAKKAKEIKEKGVVGYAAGEMGADDELASKIDSAANSAAKGDFSGAASLGASQLGADEKTSEAIGGAANSAAKGDFTGALSSGAALGAGKLGADDDTAAMVGGAASSAAKGDFNSVISSGAAYGGGQLGLDDDTAAMVGSAAGSAANGDFSGVISSGAAYGGGQLGIDGETAAMVGGMAYDAAFNRPGTDSTPEADGQYTQTGETDEFMRDNWSGEVPELGFDENAQNESVGPRKFSRPSVSNVSSTVDQESGQSGIDAGGIDIVPELNQSNADVQSVRGPRNPIVGVTATPTVEVTNQTTGTVNNTNGGNLETVPATGTMRKSFTGRPKKTLKPVTSQAVEKVSDNNISYKIVFSSAFAQESEADVDVSSVKTGTDEYGNFIFSDTMARECDLSYSDNIDEEVIMKCYQTWLKGLNDKNQTIKSAYRKDHRAAWNDHIAGDLAQAMVNKNYATTFDEAVVEDQKNKAQATSTERDEISFFGTVSQTNQELLLKLMSAESSDLITNSWSLMSNIDSDYVLEDEEEMEDK